MKRNKPLKRVGFKQKPRKPLKRTPLRKKRKNRSRREILRDKAWKAFSLWIRKRDKKCVTCGSTNNLQAGHFHHAVLDFDEVNINAQCARCNKWLSGNLSEYAVYILKKHGKKEFDALTLRKYEAMKGEIRSEQDYEQLLKTYE